MIAADPGAPDAAADAGAVLALAVVQGLTEFLPVSSSGHLVLAGALLEVPEAGLLLSVALHVGTLGAVLAVYGRDLFDLGRRALRGDLREVGLLALGTLPAAAVGILLRDAIEGAFRSPRVAGAGLLVTAALLLVGERARRRSAGRGAGEGRATRPPFGARDALAMGLAQALAICPGISRSGSTIATGLLRGLGPAAAARFSFLLSVPAIGGAALLEGLAALEGGSSATDPGLLAAAVAVSALVGWLALKVLLAVLERGAFRWFAVYCALFGAAVSVVVA